MIIDEKLKSIPSTRYQGSKRKILPWLYECLERYEFHTVLDAFGGSGMVSCLFKRMDKSVTYNDLYRFNQIIGESIIENNRVYLSDEDIQFLTSRHMKLHEKSYIGFAVAKFFSIISSTYEASDSGAKAQRIY